jgi:hypothetical protein
MLKWTLAKRKMIMHKHGTPGTNVSTHAILLSDVPHDDPHETASEDMPTLGEFTDVYDVKKVSISLTSFALSSSFTPGCHISAFRVVDSACSITLSAVRIDFVTFEAPSGPSRVGGVGVDVKGNDTV